MSEITKGPWKLLPHGHGHYTPGCGEYPHIQSESGETVIDGSWYGSYCTEADLKLIAKAPDMHAALNRIAFRCQSFLADERIMQLESIEAILAICDAALDNSSPENS